MTYTYIPKGVCSRKMTVELNDDHTIQAVRVEGGCNGNLNPVLKLACNTPEASSRIVKGILRTMSQDQKQRLATKIVNANREKLMRKLNEYAAGKGIDVHICDCAATFR